MEKPQPLRKSFLQEVAEDLYARHGDDISSLAILFPSQRARLFFIDALAGVAERPLWQPRWLTIDDLMHEVSGLRTGDRLRMLTELYKVYVKYHPNEQFDRFYFWGDMLLADFDTIDKYLIDADMLFRNLSDLKELETDVSYLTPAQLKILSFWSTFGEEASLSEEKRRFLAIWKTLGAVYRDFTARLRESGIGYGGMIQRDAAERIKRGDFAFDPATHYVAAGFNALSECEKRLFKALAAAGNTDFYWDYDDYYAKNTAQEAGMFIRENIVAFPPREAVSHDAFAQPKELNVVSTGSNAVQCKYAGNILRELAAEGPLDKETAIVLTDENLLMPLLYTIPAEMGAVNVTMGYPLRQTQAYSFLERLLALQSHARTKHLAEGVLTAFYHVDVTGLLAHPYVIGCDPALAEELQREILDNRRITVDAASLQRNDLLRTIFTPAPSWQEQSDYLLRAVEAVARQPYEGDDASQRREFLAVIAEQIVKLRNSLDACDVELATSTYASLLRRHLQLERIPFEGKPLRGIQVMGILETRNLDFRNVIILSMNDANFPGDRTVQSSFIPYNLRAAYGLPTPEHHEGVYAYYFYRLIQRAERVWMLYCSQADKKGTGEPSRYIRQLDFESGLPLRKVEVGIDVNLADTKPIEVAKTEAVMARLLRFTTAGEGGKSLSPTAFSRYVTCPLRFYFASVAGIRADDRTLEEEVDAPMFGTILHDAAQQLYTRIRGVHHPAAQLKAMAAAGEVERAVMTAINAEYLHDDRASREEYSGKLLLVSDIVTRYLRNGLIPYDAAHDDFATIGLEEPLRHDFTFTAAGRELTLRFEGRADRIDSMDKGSLRIVDYKTGSPHKEFVSVGDLFQGKQAGDYANILQTLLYAMMAYHSRCREAVPALYYVRELHKPDYSPRLIQRREDGEAVPVSYSDCKKEFEEQLQETLGEIFNPDIPFKQCDDPKYCRYCDFREICKR